MKHRLSRVSNSALPFLCLVVGYTPFERPLFAQSQELQQRVAEIKQAAAQNKQALAQYTWVEQVTISQAVEPIRAEKVCSGPGR